jgi:hypothetical protein
MSETTDDKLLDEAKKSLINLQDLLDNDQILEFIKLTRKVPTGLHPKSKDDIDKITTVLYKEMPRKWPKDLKKISVDTLNKVRLTFKLPLFRDNTLLIICLIVILLLLIIIIYNYRCFFSI